MSIEAPGHGRAPIGGGRALPIDRGSIRRIAVGVDGRPEGRDAAALAAGIARPCGAQVTLVSVHPDPVVMFPLAGLELKTLMSDERRELQQVREALAPGARITSETDLSTPRGLQRAVDRERADLLVIGSSRHAPVGSVRIGRRTRQLLGQLRCALAIAPRGMHDRPGSTLRGIGVGYDGGPESEAALALAAGVAAAAGAELRIRAVIDDRVPTLVRPALSGLVATQWRDTLAEEERRLGDQARAAACRIGGRSAVTVARGRPADHLLALAAEVDLLVIGSRRWGAAARLVLGSTGEALLQDLPCAVLIVPRPAG